MREIGSVFEQLAAALCSRLVDAALVPAVLSPCRVAGCHATQALFACGLALCFACAPTATPEPQNSVMPRYPLIPYPRQLEPRPGAFMPDTATRIVLPDGADPRIAAAAERWAERVRRATGLAIRVVRDGDVARRSAAGKDRPAVAPPAATDAAARSTRRVASADSAPATPAGDIVLILDPAASAADAEGYRLSVTPAGVTLAAADPAGLFYGLQTLRQLLPAAIETGDGVATLGAGGESADPSARGRGARATGVVTAAPSSPPTRWSIPAVEIEDAPRFPYRGMHLDVGRHFFPVAFIKKYLDLMALYRFNTFHWHLTEDQGWRIEIEKYPRLTEVGACRKETVVGKNTDPYIGDGERYCGFYTQDEIRDVVAYARDRFITIIPEIEMPGHSTAALAAYPELACSPGPFEVATTWGVFEDIYCPSERTFAFLEDVLTEVIALFPGEYVHIGGDEAPKAAWEASDLAQRIIRREGLADEAELQSWFIRRIERFLHAHGRRLIGWDEILEGGLPPDATVMSWRGMEGGIEAARQGHDVVMTPTSHLYFDYYQGDPAEEPLAIGGYTPLDKVYAFEPVPPGLTPAEAAHILGAQGNVWTEYMKTPEQVEYMVFPRLLALAEVVWSPREAREWDGFMRRLTAHLERLRCLGVNYREPGQG
ncbi:MAG TPA: beta-N-acetylhexosaminidase [Longimicrobiales bacterium]